MTDNGSIKLLIAEDHPILREAFRIFFSEQINIEVVGQAADTAQALALGEQTQPDIILVGATLRPMNMLRFISRLCEQNSDRRIVVLSTVIDPIEEKKYLEAGASQVVVKGVFASDLLTLIHQAYFKS